MFIQQSSMLVIFLLRIFLPLVDELVIATPIDFSDEFKQQQDRELGITTELPEYSEYLRRLGLREHNRQYNNYNKDQLGPQQKDSPIHSPFPFPSIQLCRERPADDDYYGHVVCWTMVALFSMSIVSLIIYQLRSILWLKFAFSRDRRQWKEFELISNGRQSDYQNFEVNFSFEKANLKLLYKTRANRMTNKIFLGCFPCDRLPSADSIQYPAALIVNLDSHEKKGSHWIAIYAYGKHREVIYFDSLALPISTHIGKFLDSFPSLKENTTAYQSPFTQTCAHFVICFVYYLAHNNSFERFLHLLNVSHNPDFFVKTFVNKMVK